MTCTPHRTKAGVFKNGSEQAALTKANFEMASRLKRPLERSEFAFIYPASHNPGAEGFGIIFSMKTSFGVEVIKWVRTL